MTFTTARYVSASADTRNPASRQTHNGDTKGSGWSERAERAFNLGAGQGKRLITYSEWQDYLRNMRNLSNEERARLHKKTQSKIRERAREKGMTPRDGNAEGAVYGYNGMISGRP